MTTLINYIFNFSQCHLKFPTLKPVALGLQLVFGFETDIPRCMSMKKMLYPTFATGSGGKDSLLHPDVLEPLKPRSSLMRSHTY